MPAAWERFKERKVVQWAVGYMAAGWAVLEVLSQLAETFHWPDRVMQAITILLGLGLFAVAIVAYFHGERGEQRVRAPEVVLLAIVALVGMSLVYFMTRPSASDASAAAPVPTVTAKSIAVLPFATITDDETSSAFAAGVQDAILTLLAKVGDLKVISRTSTQQYASGARDVRAVRSALGVSTILEGSVQRAGDRIRVQAQLIDAVTDTHKWAEEYNGDITDLFAIQSEIANAIVTELKAQLTEGERKRISTAPSQNAAAYDAYSSGREHEIRPGNVKHNVDAAAQLYRRAIDLDPLFALAYARLSFVEGTYHFYNLDPDPRHRAQQREAADRALELAPDLPEAHWAKAIDWYWNEQNYEKALRELQIAHRGLPNDAEIIYWIGTVYRRQGKWALAEKYFRDAIEKDPRNVRFWTQGLCGFYLRTHKLDHAVGSCKRALEIAPTNYLAAQNLWRAELRRTGTLDGLRGVLGDSVLARAGDEAREADFYRLYYFTREADNGLQLVLRTSADLSGQREFLPRQLAAASLYRLKNDTRRAHANFDSTRVIADSAVRANPHRPIYHVALGRAYAGLGMTREALNVARNILSMKAVTEDKLDGPFMQAEAARILGEAGRRDDAVEILRRVVDKPGGPGSAELKVDPSWDSLRNDPGFRALLH